MHPALKKGTTIYICCGIFGVQPFTFVVEFLVISLFHQTKISTVDMKVQVYSNFSKKEIRKKNSNQAR
jgi:hypothetical protein